MVQAQLHAIALFNSLADLQPSLMQTLAQKY